MKTYEIGLLQAKAYRVLKKKTKMVLGDYNIDDIEWSILGVIDHEKFATTSLLSNELSVETSFINKVANRLIDKGLIEQIDHESDRRSFYYQLCPKGKKLILELEPKLMKEVGKLVRPLSLQDIAGYKRTLEKIISHESK